MLFDSAWSTYKTHFVKLLKINLIPVALISIILTAFPFLTEFQEMIAYLGPADIVRIMALVFGVMILVSALSSANYIAQVKYLLEEGDMTLVAAYRHAAHILFPYIWMLVLAGLCVLAGTIFFIVPGIVIAVWLSFSSYLLIEGKAKGLAALKLSKSYVRGIWSQVFLRLLAVAFLGLLVSSAVTILIGFVKLAITQNPIAEDVVNFIYQLVIAPYFVVYGYELYKDVVKANQAVGVEGNEAAADSGAHTDAAPSVSESV